MARWVEMQKLPRISEAVASWEKDLNVDNEPGVGLCLIPDDVDTRDVAKGNLTGSRAL